MSWLNILKISDGVWKKVIWGVLNDTLPQSKTTGSFNKKKYVKFSNLDSINKKVVKYYLNKGIGASDKVKEECMIGIKEEMARSSNERYDIQDKGGQ